jgi:hypothetical protein
MLSNMLLLLALLIWELPITTLRLVMGLNIHEHDLVLMMADNNFVECMTCSAVYCVLCEREL